MQRGAEARSVQPSSTTSPRSTPSTGPGAMRYIPDYARGKRDPSSVRYPDDRLRPITDETYGCVIYQEQLMEISKQIGGFSPAEADDLRKAVGKKKRDLMATMKDMFLEGCKASGTSARSPRPVVTDDRGRRLLVQQVPRRLLRADLLPHRLPKANYPAEYMAAVISSVMSTKDKVPFFVNRCEEMDIEVLPPDVNSSDHGFVVCGQVDPLRPRRGQERRPRGGRGDPRARASAAGRSSRSGTSASASTPARSTSARSSA